MKMCPQVIPHSFVWFVSLCAALTIGIIGCGDDDDDNDWVGTWGVETIDGESLEQVFEEVFEQGAGQDVILNSSMTFNYTFMVN